MISTRMFIGIVVLVLSAVSATVYEESTGWCRPPNYVGGVELLWTLDQCRNYCEAVPTCTGFHFTNLMGPQHATVHQRCWPFSASRGCNQQEKQAEIQRYRDLKLDCCLDLSCPNKQYLSGAVGASKYNWICGRTFTRKHPRTQSPTVQPTALPTLNPTSNPSLSPSSNPSLNPTSNPSLNPSSSPTLTPTTNPSKRPTAEDFIVKVKAFHGEPKDVLDSSKLQDQPEVDAEIFGFEHKLTPLTRRLLNRFYDVQEEDFVREDNVVLEEQLLELLSETTAKDLAVKKNENLPEF